MVGSVLMERMREENDFAGIEPMFFSTSQAGANGPEINEQKTTLLDAYDQIALSGLDVIVSCQGSDYTRRVHPELRSSGWNGYWIDAASYLRNEDSSVLVLDPVNRHVIESAVNADKKDLIGANCTTSLAIMGLAGLLNAGEVESINIASYQAVSGAGAKHMTELLEQMQSLGNAVRLTTDDPASTILDIDRTVTTHLRSGDLPVTHFGYPIAGNVLPWIDSEMDTGQSREEWKVQVEANKILGLNPGIIVDGTCVRVGSMRSHSQAVIMKLKRDIPLSEIEQIITSAHEWIDFVPNIKEATLSRLTPVAVSGTLKIAVGRVRKLNNGPEYLNAFVTGDQLLWGAAEPLRRALNIVLSP